MVIITTLTGRVDADSTELIHDTMVFIRVTSLIIGPYFSTNAWNKKEEESIKNVRFAFFEV
jgi:hypothetical protein